MSKDRGNMGVRIDEKLEESQLSMEEVMAEMRRLQKGLPVRPAAEQVEAARSAIVRADSLLISRLEELFTQPRPAAVPTAAFRAFQEMREDVLRCQVQEQKRPWMSILEVEDRHRHYDSLIRRVQAVLQVGSRGLGIIAKETSAIDHNQDGELRSRLSSPEDDQAAAFDKPFTFGSPKETATFGLAYKQLDRPRAVDDSLLQTLAAVYKEIVGEKPVVALRSPVGPPKQLETRVDHSAMALASSKSTSAAPSSNLNGLLLSSNGRLSHSSSSSSSVFEPLSTIHEDRTGSSIPQSLINILEKAIENQPESLDFGGMHFEGIVAFPESIGLVTSLKTLNLSGTQIQALPVSIGALINIVKLDVEANQLRELPESIGCLSHLKVLNFEKNMVEELPWTIKHCTALEELRADFNLLKGLPEGIGNLTCLRILSVHLNSLKSLPTTIGNLKALEELYVHFNQLEYVPESLCSLVSLKRLNLSSNFTDLKALPESIGNLQSLEYLNISYNHLTLLPDSFANLSSLQKLELDGNPFYDPPLYVVQKGKDEIFKYMKEKVTRKWEIRTAEDKRGFFQRLIFSCMGAANVKSKKLATKLGPNVLA